MEVFIDADERYPVYVIETGKAYGSAYSVNKRKVQRWKRIIEEYNRVQDEMEKVFDGENYYEWERRKRGGSK